MPPTVYVSKRKEIEAIQFCGTFEEGMEIQKWLHSNNTACVLTNIGPDNVVVPGKTFIVIHTPEGSMLGCAGDYIIRGTRGEFYPCKPEPFADSYVRKEPVDVSRS